MKNSHITFVLSLLKSLEPKIVVIPFPTSISQSSTFLNSWLISGFNKIILLAFFKFVIFGIFFCHGYPVLNIKFIFFGMIKEDSILFEASKGNNSDTTKIDFL